VEEPAVRAGSHIQAATTRQRFPVLQIFMQVSMFLKFEELTKWD